MMATPSLIFPKDPTRFFFVTTSNPRLWELTFGNISDPIGGGLVLTERSNGSANVYVLEFGCMEKRVEVAQSFGDSTSMTQGNSFCLQRLPLPLFLSNNTPPPLFLPSLINT